MPTIDELMAGKKPGEIKICMYSWKPHQWFRPFFKAQQNALVYALWRGVDETGFYATFTGALGDNWTLWKDIEEQKPVEEVEVFEWMYSQGRTPYWTVEGCLLTEEQAKKFFDEGEEYRKTGRSWRLPR